MADKNNGSSKKQAPKKTPFKKGGAEKGLKGGRDINKETTNASRKTQDKR